MTLWRDRLGALAHDRLPAEAAAAWSGLFRPGIRLHAGGEGPAVAQLGGNPALPDDVEWPVWPEHGPLSFVAAVDCAALPRDYLTIPLPDAGTLLFFYFDGSYPPACDLGAVPEDAEGSRVLFVPAGTPVTERAAPDGLKTYPRQDLFAGVVATAPERGHLLLEQTETASGASLEDALGPDRQGTGVFAKLRWEAHDGSALHQVGGFAAPVQEPVESEIAAIVLDATWASPELIEEAGRWVLLAQFDSDGGAGMMWNDAGMLYWVIRSADLAAGRFSAARCLPQSG